MTIYKLTQTIIPGIVFIVFGFTFILSRHRFVNLITDVHNRFWKGIVGFQGEVGRFGELFIKIMSIVLGAGFLLAGAILIYRYFNK